MTNAAQQLNENDKVVDFKIQLDATGSIYPVLKKAIEEVYFVLVLDGVCDELSESDLDSFCDNIEIVQLNETTFSFELAEETYTVNLLI